ncbi:hypothetical protein FF1_042477 [Malus domestica]
MLTRLLSAVLRLHHRRFGLSVFEVPSLSLRLHKFFATRLQAKLHRPPTPRSNGAHRPACLHLRLQLSAAPPNRDTNHTST